MEEQISVCSSFLWSFEANSTWIVGFLWYSRLLFGAKWELKWKLEKWRFASEIIISYFFIVLQNGGDK